MTRSKFSQLNTWCFRLAVTGHKCKRSLKKFVNSKRYAIKKGSDLEHVLYRHKSLIRRTLGHVNMQLQENKAHNLSLAAPRIDSILIRPGETFSFWTLVGDCTAKKGYKEGLVIRSGNISRGLGGGLCQFTNLIHWLILHSPLDIIEHHHHNGYDLFPDFQRQVPFGVGTSIMYNYLDYQVKNTTAITFQLCVWVCDSYLNGELRANQVPELSYHIKEEDAFFSCEEDQYYRHNKIYRQSYNRITGDLVERTLVIENKAKVMYELNADQVILKTDCKNKRIG